MAVQQQSFEEVWAALSGRLQRVLQSRRVPDECIDDVVQETGLRLLRNWAKVDQSTIWSFTLTIAGNIIKDDMRRRARDEKFAESLPTNSYVDIEERALARVELWKTHRAIDALSSVQRTALLTEVYGFETTTARNTGAAKMSRLRARRTLRQALGRASGLIALGGHRLRRIMFGDPRGGLTESASHTVAAALLIAAGVDLVMLGGGLFRAQPPNELGRIAMSAPFAKNLNGELAATGATARATRSFLSPTSSQPSPATTGHSPDEVMVEHSESVGTHGAHGSFNSVLMGQRASVEVQVLREDGECQGTRGMTPVCVGSFSVGAVAHHNGKSYGARATTSGRVTVINPYNVGH